MKGGFDFAAEGMGVKKNRMLTNGCDVVFNKNPPFFQNGGFWLCG
jgi:hypothetical protein